MLVHNVQRVANGGRVAAEAAQQACGKAKHIAKMRGVKRAPCTTLHTL